jgi:hypothetical protein
MKRLWTRFRWLRIRYYGGFLWKQRVSFGIHKSILQQTAEEISASQEGRWIRGEVWSLVRLYWLWARAVYAGSPSSGRMVEAPQHPSFGPRTTFNRRRTPARTQFVTPLHITCTIRKDESFILITVIFPIGLDSKPKVSFFVDPFTGRVDSSTSKPSL